MAEAKISVEIEVLDKSSEEFKRFEQKVLRFKGNVEGSLRQVSAAARVATKDVKALNAQLNSKSGLGSSRAANGLKVTVGSIKGIGPSANAAKIGLGALTQGMSAFLGVSAGIAGVVVGMKRLIASGREYSVVLAEIATLTNEASFSSDQQRKIVEDLSDKYGVLQNEVGKGLYQTISAGATDAALANDILRESIGLSIAGVASVKESVDILTSTLNSYGEENISATRASDVLFETVKRGKTTMSELSSVLGRVLPLAREVGVSFEEVTAAIVSQTKQGASTAESVTRLRSIFSALIKKQDEVAEIFRTRLGLTFDEFTIQSIGLAKTLDLLRRATAGNRDELTKLIGRIEGTTGVLALTADKSKLFVEALDGIERASGSASSALNEFRNTSGRKLEEFWDRVSNKAARFGERVAEGVVAALESLGAIELRPEAFSEAFREAMNDSTSGLTDFAQAYADLQTETNRELAFSLSEDEIQIAAERVAYLEKRLADLGSETVKLAADTRGVRVEYDLLNEKAGEFLLKTLAAADPRGSGEDAKRSLARIVGEVRGSVPSISLLLNIQDLDIENPEAIVSGLNAALAQASRSLSPSEGSRLLAEAASSDFATIFEKQIGRGFEDVLEPQELFSVAPLLAAEELYAKALSEGFEKIRLNLSDGSYILVEGFEESLGQITPVFSDVMEDASAVVENSIVTIDKQLKALGSDLSVKVTPFAGLTGGTDDVAKAGREISDQIDKQVEANNKLLASQEQSLRIRKEEAALLSEGKAKKEAEAENALLESKIKLAKDFLDEKITESEFTARFALRQRAYELEIAKIRQESNKEFREETERLQAVNSKMFEEMIDKLAEAAEKRKRALQDEADLQDIVIQARRVGLEDEEKAYAKINTRFDELVHKARQQENATQSSIDKTIELLEVERQRVLANEQAAVLLKQQEDATELLAATVEARLQNELNIASAIAHMQGESVGQAYDEIAAIEERLRLRQEELNTLVQEGILSSESANAEIRQLEALAELDKRRVDENLRLRSIQDGAGAFGESFSLGVSSVMENLSTMGDLGRELGVTFANSAGQFASAMATNSASFESFKNTMIAGILQLIAKWATFRIVAGLGLGSVGATPGAAGLDNPTTPGGNFVQLNATGGVMGGSIVGTTSLPVNAYSNGGVASTPQLAIFGEGRGAEAFVPLPDGRRIPVDVGGAFTALSSQMRAMTSMMASGRGGMQGGHTVNLSVDARGAQDAAGVEAAVERTLMKSMPRIEKALGNSMAAGTSGALVRGARRATRGR
jgi:TP901 family phage tail tape measure protein